MNKFLAKSNLIPAYQPIVEIDTREVVGFEALARWPALAGATPDVVFAEAREHGFLVELDWACRLGAVEGAIGFGFGVEHTLFVNVEPDTIGRQVQSLAAVMAHSERTGATILAEGIETQAHIDQALALGATLGQGYLFGRPGPLFHSPLPAKSIAFARAESHQAMTPFALVAARKQIRVGHKGLLLDLTRHIESQGLQLVPPPVVLSAFQTAKNFTAATAKRYTELAKRCPLVGALGVGIAVDAAPGVHGAGLATTDPLVGEWTVTAVGPHYAGALIARDLGDDGPDHGRRFEFVVTHDRDLVVAAARSLIARITIN